MTVIHVFGKKRLDSQMVEYHYRVSVLIDNNRMIWNAQEPRNFMRKKMIMLLEPWLYSMLRRLERNKENHFIDTKTTNKYSI